MEISMGILKGYTLRYQTWGNPQFTLGKSSKIIAAAGIFPARVGCQRVVFFVP